MPENIQALIATITDFNRYLELAQRTNSTYDAEARLQLLHSFMGVVGEQAEILSHFEEAEKRIGLSHLREERDEEEKIEEYQDIMDTAIERSLAEYGDLFWYCATLYDALRAMKKEFNLPNIPLQSGLLFSLSTEFETLCQETIRQHSGKETADLVLIEIDSTLRVNQDLLKDVLILDDVKKVFVYKQKCKEEWFQSLVWSLEDKLKSIQLFLLDYNAYYPIAEDLTLMGLAKSNIAKLASRFGDKFSVERSENRDYNQESLDSGIESA